MLSIKTFIYLGFLIPAVLGSIFFNPIIGLYGYLLAYNINPAGHWWGQAIPRYSFILAAATGIGVVIHYSKLRFKNILEGQEILLLIFLIIIWMSILLGLGTSSLMEYSVSKMTKIVIILLIASHLITTYKFYEWMIWIFILAGVYLCYQLHSGEGVFQSARYHAGVGGSDFTEGNFLAAHFGFLLPLVGAMFLKGKWKTRVVCLVSAVLIVNSIVMTRSRAIMLALSLGCVVALFYFPRLKQFRKIILILLLLGIVGVAYLTDPGFWSRMGTIQVQEELRDTSAQNRIKAWKGAWSMAKDHPMGVGIGNFFDYIGYYDPDLQGKDTHNTYLRCLAELGFHGLFVLILIIYSAFRTLSRICKDTVYLTQEKKEAYLLHAYAVRTSLAVYLVAAMFISSTYIEEFHWLLMFPVFLKRAMENEPQMEYKMYSNRHSSGAHGPS